MANVNIFAPYYFSYNRLIENGHVMEGVGIDFEAIARGERPFTQEDFDQLSKEKATAVLKQRYWDKLRADEIKSQSVANYVVDWFIHSGRAGISGFQTLVGAAADGMVGPMTLKYVNAKEPLEILEKARKMRIAMYESKVKVSPSMQETVDQWKAQLDDLQMERLVCRGGWTVEFDDATYQLKNMVEQVLPVEEMVPVEEMTQPEEIAPAVDVPPVEDTAPTETDVPSVDVPPVEETGWVQSEGTPPVEETKPASEEDDFARSMNGLNDLMNQLGI